MTTIDRTHVIKKVQRDRFDHIYVETIWVTTVTDAQEHVVREHLQRLFYGNPRWHGDIGGFDESTRQVAANVVDRHPSDGLPEP